MTESLSSTELATVRSQLQGYPETQAALTVLADQNGQLEEALEIVLREKAGAPPMYGDRSLWSVTKEVLRQELCGNEGFRSKLEEYSKKGNAPMLAGLIVYLATQVTLPFPIDPGLVTLVVLYIAKVGMNIFCEFTKPEES